MFALQSFWVTVTLISKTLIWKETLNIFFLLKPILLGRGMIFFTILILNNEKVTSRGEDNFEAVQYFFKLMCES